MAAFIAEPVQGAGGVIVPPADYFPRIREICDRYDVLLIADEVITGFGRTGRWFGLEHYGIEPDIVQFAKGITSGYVPLGGIGVSDRDARRDPRRAAGQALDARLHLLGTPDLLRRGAEEHRNRRARAARRSCRGRPAIGCSPGCASWSRIEGVGHVRGLGLMAAVEVVADKTTKALFPPEVGLSQRLQDAMLDYGLATRVAMDCICLAPPLVITDEEIDRAVDSVRQAIATVLAQVGTTGAAPAQPPAFRP